MPKVTPLRLPENAPQVRGVSLIRPPLRFGVLDTEALRGRCPTPAFDAVRIVIYGLQDFTSDSAHTLAGWASAGWTLQIEGSGPALPDLVRTVRRMAAELHAFETAFVETR